MSAVLTVRRRLRLRRPHLALSRRAVRLTVLLSLASALILAGGWFMLRDSSLVAVQHVTITGQSGSDADAIRLALESAALKMTTLDVQTGRLRAVVSRFPEVKGLRVSADFPHRLVIHVLEVLPVAVVQMFGRDVPVTGDGMLLPHVAAGGTLPLITLPEPLSGDRLQQSWALGAARLLAAAPPRLLPRLAEAMAVAGHGLVVQVRSGPSIYFGDPTELQAKWSAVLAVLANQASAGAAYIDVTDPQRPVAGAAASATASANTSTTATSTTTSAAVSGTAAGAGGTPASTAASGQSTAQTSSATGGSTAQTSSATGGSATSATGAPTTSSTAPTGG